MGAVLVSLSVLVLLILGLPALVRLRLNTMNDTARATAPGSLAKLGDGVTHYQWHGPATGQVVVLVHGLTTPSFVWAGIIPHLTGAGFRVLTYDLYGRGYSDRPRGKQSGAFFSRQITDLLKDQMVSKPVILVGYSMGGAIVSAFASQHPDKVARLVLLASAGFSHATGGMTHFIRSTPVIGDWLMSVFGGAQIRRGAKADNTVNSVIPDITALQIRETTYRGYTRSVLSSLRNLLGQPFDGLHSALARHNIPTLAIWGDIDAVIPVASAARLSAANPDVTTVVLEGADHTLAYTMADRTAGEITGWLQT